MGELVTAWRSARHWVRRKAQAREAPEGAGPKAASRALALMPKAAWAMQAASTAGAKPREYTLTEAGLVDRLRQARVAGEFLLRQAKSIKRHPLYPITSKLQLPERAFTTPFSSGSPIKTQGKKALRENFLSRLRSPPPFLLRFQNTKPFSSATSRSPAAARSLTIEAPASAILDYTYSGQKIFITMQSRVRTGSRFLSAEVVKPHHIPYMPREDARGNARAILDPADRVNLWSSIGALPRTDKIILFVAAFLLAACLAFVVPALAPVEQFGFVRDLVRMFLPTQLDKYALADAMMMGLLPFGIAYIFALFLFFLLSETG